jgi:hypothetical protein
MINRGEKLSQVKCNHTSFEFCMPPCSDHVSKKAPSIFGGVLTNPSKLVGMEDSMFSCFELQPIGEHFLKHLAQSVQKNNWVKQFGSVIQQLSRFWYHHRSRGLELSRPVARLKTGVHQP